MAYGLTRFERSRFSVGNPLPSVIAGRAADRSARRSARVPGRLGGHLGARGSGRLCHRQRHRRRTVGLGRGSAGFGIANQVTLLRAGLVCLASGALLAGAPSSISGWSLAALVAAALCLDAVDGWLARRLGLVVGFWRPVRSRDRCAADPGARASGLAERPRRAVGSDDRPDALRRSCWQAGGSCPPCVGRCRRAGDDRRCACSRE